MALMATEEGTGTGVVLVRVGLWRLLPTNHVLLRNWDVNIVLCHVLTLSFYLGSRVITV